MAKRSSGIRFVPGSTDILIVAPHGPLGFAGKVQFVNNIAKIKKQ